MKRTGGKIKLGKPESKQEVVHIRKEAPEPPKTSPQQAYLDDIKHAGSVAQIKNIVSLSEKDSELAGWQKEAIKKYGITISQTLDI